MQNLLFTDKPDFGSPFFEHSYCAPCTFLGTFQNMDLYHSVLGNNKPMLIERYSSEPFKFNGEDAKTVYEKCVPDENSALGEAWRRANNLKLKLT
jgi:hypothetical protein